MGIINNKDVIGIIRKTLRACDERIMEHGDIVGYIFYKMLQYENKYSRQELIDYALLGIFHDIGFYKDSEDKKVFSETRNYWKHSIYGYLFLKYLSPIGENADIVLFHHLHYKKYALISSHNRFIIECLNFADQLHMHIGIRCSESDFFAEEKAEEYSPRAKDVFLKADKKYHILENIENKRYLEELNDIIGKKLFSEEQRRGFLQMLIYTIDFRSEFTVIHTLATTTFATQIASLMGLPARDIYMIYYGSLLHDVGKILIPVEILEAPRALNDEEMEIMKSHVRYTEEILMGAVDQEVLDIAINHHEKLDGSGYSQGLTEDQLTIPQKIVAVADMVSALSQRRIYKEAFDPQTIIEILQKDVDDHKIYKDAVDCFINNYDIVMQKFEQTKKATIGTYVNILKLYEENYEKFKQFEPEN